MDPNERLRRPEPERTGPNRGMSGMYRQPDPWARDRVEGQRWFDQRPYRSGEGPPSDGVDPAYKVYENWFREGQRSAQFNSRRWNDTRFDPRGSGAPISESVQRLMRSYYDMGPTFADFVTSMATLWCNQMYPYHSYARYAPHPHRADYGKEPERDSSRESGANVSVKIDPPNRGQANLQIHPIPAEVKVLPLLPVDLDPERKPLWAITNMFNQRTTLTVDVKDAPAGVYIGAVLDTQNNHPVGNLTVTVRERAAQDAGDQEQ